MSRLLKWASCAATISLVAGSVLINVIGCGKNSTTNETREDKATSSSLAADSASTRPTQNDLEPEFSVPKGTSKEILKFVRGLGKQRPQFGSRKEAYEHSIKTQQAIIRAGDAILNQEADDESLKEALTRKLLATIGLAANGVGGSPAEVLAEVERFRADPRPIVVEAGNQFWIAAKSLDLSAFSETEQAQLADQAIERVTASQATQQSMGDVDFMANQMLKANQTVAAASLYDRLAEAIVSSSTDTKTLAMVSQLKGKASRLRLPGSQLELEGRLLDGGEFNWESYRGKVVLVDFWATWCGPCVAELPNIQSNYAKYHDRGFDVVAISLDNERSALERFVTRESFPWKQLFDDASGVGKGWRHPMAVRYGVSSIPAAFLVDREGKVVSTNARGEELDRQLQHLLGSVN